MHSPAVKTAMAATALHSPSVTAVERADLVREGFRWRQSEDL
ncbi:hypothetical protein DSOL_2428 [Desulfosporosinus metallidurans]|uniref:Uncharacterized protein n=1 Tax=Desulfosporosinus metallidurans TaxID=1888891 RepID=A0A1Q8QWQ3_9FIRM|nr:hypothetical protein DSOL_2428 [Desulfosporosinus metallidurans]